MYRGMLHGSDEPLCRGPGYGGSNLVMWLPSSGTMLRLGQTGAIRVPRPAGVRCRGTAPSGEQLLYRTDIRTRCRLTISTIRSRLRR